MMWKLVLPVFAAVFAVGSGAMTGGFRDIEVNDEGALAALKVAVDEHNRRSNDLYRSEVAEVVSVQRQVVAGLKYNITVTMAKTPCRKERLNEVCEIHQDAVKAQPYQCTFTVLTRSWENMIEVLKETC